MNESSQIQQRLLAFLAILATITALQASYPVSMPMLFAALIVGALWPLKLWLERWLPPWPSYALTVLALLAILLGFASAVYVSTGQLLQVMESRWAEIEREYAGMVRAASNIGIAISAPDRGRIFAFVQTVASSTYSFATYVGFIGLLVMFGLPEVGRLQDRIPAAFGEKMGGTLVSVAERASQQIRSYLGTTLFTSFLTGAFSTIWAFATGLELALVWGLLNFLLNFIPVIGNIVGIVPPVLYALLQFDGAGMPLLILGGFIVLQIAISNFVYPVLQGRQLSLSPLAILIAMAFWSWLWGIAGALIAVPLTATLVIACEQSERSRWFSRLVSQDREGPS
ncbi:MAG: AI-2E family transporter [Sphingobium limneticum]